PPPAWYSPATRTRPPDRVPGMALVCGGVMLIGRRVVAAAAVLAAATFSIVVHADVRSSSGAAAIQLQLGGQFMEEGRYRDALTAFQAALNAPGGSPRDARIGIVQVALRLAEFNLAREA